MQSSGGTGVPQVSLRMPPGQVSQTRTQPHGHWGGAQQHGLAHRPAGTGDRQSQCWVTQHVFRHEGLALEAHTEGNPPPGSTLLPASSPLGSGGLQHPVSEQLTHPPAFTPPHYHQRCIRHSPPSAVAPQQFLSCWFSTESPQAIYCYCD